MAQFTFEEKQYDTEELSDNGKAQFASLQFIEVQMRKLKAEIAVYQTARNVYSNALQEELTD